MEWSGWERKRRQNGSVTESCFDVTCPMSRHCRTSSSGIECAIGARTDDDPGEASSQAVARTPRIRTDPACRRPQRRFLHDRAIRHAVRVGAMDASGPRYRSAFAFPPDAIRGLAASILSTSGDPSCDPGRSEEAPRSRHVGDSFPLHARSPMGTKHTPMRVAEALRIFPVHYSLFRPLSTA